jgi:teichuronic acid biosynthesis glycosyltransferase TuaH
MIPNGCDAERFRSTDSAPTPSDVRLKPPIAGFVGQFNDRVDVSFVEAVADRGHSLLFVGPLLAVQEPERVKRLFARPNVQWMGPRPFEQMPSYLKMIDVGLTPYADTEFNRASMPLKTIEYLAAGRAAISTDLPGARFLATDLVTRCASASEFAEATSRSLEMDRTDELVRRRRAFAAMHSWAVRAAEFACAWGLSAADAKT